MTLRLALTPGEPAGIGPDLLIRMVQDGCDHELVAYADPQLLEQRAAELNLSRLVLREPGASPQPLKPGELAIVPVSLAEPAVAGQLNSANGDLRTPMSGRCNCRLPAAISARRWLPGQYRNRLSMMPVTPLPATLNIWRIKPRHHWW